MVDWELGFNGQLFFLPCCCCDVAPNHRGPVASMGLANQIQIGPTPSWDGGARQLAFDETRHRCLAWTFRSPQLHRINLSPRNQNKPGVTTSLNNTHNGSNRAVCGLRPRLHSDENCQPHLAKANGDRTGQHLQIPSKHSHELTVMLTKSMRNSRRNQDTPGQVWCRSTSRGPMSCTA